MARCNRLLIVLTVWLLPWLGRPPCRAQPPTQPPPALPPAPPPQPRAPAGAGIKEQSPATRPSLKVSLELPPPPDSQLEKDLQVAPLEAGDLRFPINLAAALRLADARPIMVALAQSKAWVAEGQLRKDQVLWVPSFNVAADYIRHDGPGPDLNNGINVPEGVNALGQAAPGSLGRPLNQNINFFYAGGGVMYVPPAPDLVLQPDPTIPLLPMPERQFLTDMIFQPLAARQVLNSRRWDIQTQKNDALLMTARAYFDVHRYRGQYAGALDTVRKGRRLVEEIAVLSRDLVPAVEVDRARNLLADLEQQAVSARENWRLASARLTQELRLDPRAVVEPLERDHLQITLIDPSRSLDDLIPLGLTNRPELAAHQALVQAVLVAIRREKLRPLLPSLYLNGFQTPFEAIEAGVYGVGSGGKLNQWSGRDDFSPEVMFTAYSMGLGNAGMVKEQRGRASQQIVELFRVQDAVAADVTRAQADVQSAAGRVVQAERQLQAALRNYNGNYEGLRQTTRLGNVLIQAFRPQEVVFALQLLKTAYDNYFMTVAEYNTAQFELFHALGYPARDLSLARSPGEPVPVNTERPAYLPAVGTGPPPATR
jgi:hypothetical protein